MGRPQTPCAGGGTHARHPGGVRARVPTATAATAAGLAADDTGGTVRPPPRHGRAVCARWAAATAVPEGSAVVAVLAAAGLGRDAHPPPPGGWGCVMTGVVTTQGRPPALSPQWRPAGDSARPMYGCERASRVWVWSMALGPAAQ